MGRIKEASRKPSGRRRRNPVIYLICEGTETEIRYFKRFRSRGCSIDIIPISSKYKAAEGLVQKVRSTMGENPYYPEDGDMIWCVFDCDENTNEMLAKAKRIANRENYRIAFSNPSFEVWFLYHFSNPAAEIVDCDAAIKLLRQRDRLEQYEKNRDVYDILKPLQEQAIERAKKRISSLEKNGVEVVSRQSNPVTTVVELVEFLNSRQ